MHDQTRRPVFYLLPPQAAGEKLHLSPDDAHQGKGGGNGGGIEVGGRGPAHVDSKSQIELNDVSTGVTGSTTVTSRSSRSFDVSSSVNPKSEAGPSEAGPSSTVEMARQPSATTVNGNLAPPPPQML